MHCASVPTALLLESLSLVSVQPLLRAITLAPVHQLERVHFCYHFQTYQFLTLPN